MSYPRILVGIAALSGIVLMVLTQNDTTTVAQPVALEANSNRIYSQVETVSRDELAISLGEIALLRREVADLSIRVSQLQGQEQHGSERSSEPPPIEAVYSVEERNHSIADRFEYGNRSSQGTRFDDTNLEGVIYASVSPYVEVYSADCRGSLCKVYVSSASDENYETASTEQFTTNIADSLDGNVNIYFDEEGGQQVMYVESVE